MSKSSPTRPLSGRSILYRRNTWTKCDGDGMPRTNLTRLPPWSVDPTRRRALALIDAQRPRERAVTCE